MCIGNEAASSPSPANDGRSGLASPIPLLRVEEAAALLRIGRSKLYQLIAAGEIPTVKVGTARRISEAALDQWLRERTRYGR